VAGRLADAAPALMPVFRAGNPRTVGYQFRINTQPDGPPLV
jgi:hypothetical protein